MQAISSAGLQQSQLVFPALLAGHAERCALPDETAHQLSRGSHEDVPSEGPMNLTILQTISSSKA